jgi:hypothetical protein
MPDTRSLGAVRCAVPCEVTAERSLLRRRRRGSKRPHTAARSRPHNRSGSQRHGAAGWKVPTLVVDTDTRMLAIVSSNSQAPTVMIAEKAWPHRRTRTVFVAAEWDTLRADRRAASRICNGRTSHQCHESPKQSK